ncbi:Ldh family oxidoreductase [Sulfitobacter sp. AS92]|uniref:Ldh family oxidoreductase n=1 Tax=Sulfitobacter sp. AS92 TaxID=3135783 RepID=UPI00317F52EE
MPKVNETTLIDLVCHVFERTGMRSDMARDAAGVLVTTEMMGIRTHGLTRVEPYATRLRDGGVNPAALPIITAPAPALRQVDGQNGLGAAVALRATQAAMQAAREVGLGAAFCRGSSHLGALAPQLLLAAEAEFAAFFCTNTSPMIAPPGGQRPVIGNTPLGIALPDQSGWHVILDIAMSVVARSRVRQAAARGDAIPESWATDAAGNPTTDAAAAMQGMMQAIGGTKGANLALCLDLLVGGLSGAAMLSEIPNANLDTQAVANVGHLFLVIDAARLMPPAALSERLGDAREMLSRGAAENAAAPPRMPGTRALEKLAQARSEGVEIETKLYARLQDLAGA